MQLKLIVKPQVSAKLVLVLTTVWFVIPALLEASLAPSMMDGDQSHNDKHICNYQMCFDFSNKYYQTSLKHQLNAFDINYIQQSSTTHSVGTTE